MLVTHKPIMRRHIHNHNMFRYKKYPKRILFDILDKHEFCRDLFGMYFSDTFRKMWLAC